MNVRYLKQCKSRISVILINILMILSLWVTCASWIRCVVFRLFGHGSLLQSTCSIICQSKSAQNPGRSGWKMYCTGRLIFSRQPFETFLLWLVHCFSSWTLTVLNHMYIYIYNYMIIISSGSKHLFSVSWLRQQKNIKYSLRMRMSSFLIAPGSLREQCPPCGRFVGSHWSFTGGENSDETAAF